MDNEQSSLSNDTTPFYDSQGCQRILVDNYYDEEGNLHKVRPLKEPDEDSRDPPDPEVKPRSKAVTKIKIKVTLKSNL